MENNELLQAMQAMMKEEISGLRQEMSAQEKRTDEKFSSLRQEMSANAREIKKEINGVDMKLDRHFQQIQNLLKEDYSPVAETARETKEKISDYDEVKSTQADHTRAIQTHNERITELEGKAI